MRGKATKATALVVGLTLILGTGTAAAKTFKVTRTNDPAPNRCKNKDCSLREAVIAANKTGARDGIVLQAGKRYVLSRPLGLEDDPKVGDLDISEPVTISSAGKGRATIAGSPGLGDRLIEIGTGARTTLRSLVLTGGRADPEEIGGDYYGGAVSAVASLTIANSVIKGNQARTYGGGVFADQGIVRVVRSKFIGNRAGSDSGALDATPKRLVIEDSTFHDNRSGSDGGTMYLSVGSNQVAKITGSTFSANRAGDDGGAINHTNGRLVVTNSTFFANSSDTRGGALALNSRATLNAVTIVHNSAATGGGMNQTFPQGGTVRNSIIARNDAPEGPDCYGDFGSAGKNLIGDDSDCSGFVAPKNIIGKNPRVAPLRNNGGPTRTVALQPNSPAIGKANRKSAPKRDQRGRKRDKRPDIGAYERGA